MFNSCGNIVESLNQEAEVLFGWTTAEIVGSSMTMLIPHDYSGDVRTFFEATANSKDGSTFQVFILLPSNSGSKRRIGLLFNVVRLML